MAGHGSLPPRKERTERAQRRCSRVAECRLGRRFPGTLGHVTVPDIRAYGTITSINAACCCCARASAEFLTERSAIGGNCVDFFIAKVLFEELQSKSVKSSDTAMLATASSCSTVPCGGEQAPKQGGSCIQGLHLQPKLGERRHLTDTLRPFFTENFLQVFAEERVFPSWR